MATALVSGCENNILTIGDSWTLLYNPELVKLMVGKRVGTKSQGGYPAYLAKQELPSWLDQNRNAEVAFILLGGGDFISYWETWVEEGCEEANTNAYGKECTPFPCPVPAPDTPLVQGWIAQILADLTEIGDMVKAQGIVPVFGTYSTLPPMEECDQDYYFCEQDRINLNAALLELSERSIEIAGEEDFEVLDMRGLHEENCCCFQDPIHPSAPGAAGVVSGSQLVAEKWCEKYIELFGEQPNITCEFVGTPCIELQAPECAAKGGAGELHSLESSVQTLSSEPFIRDVSNF